MGETWQCGCSCRNAQPFPPPPSPPFPFHARYPESSLLCWEHGTVHARLISPRPSCPSMPEVSEEVDGSQGSGSPPSSLPHPGPIAHLSLKRKTMLGVAENGNSLRRSCEFGSDLLWPPPLESEGQYTDAAHTHTHLHHELPPIIRPSRQSLCPPCGFLWSLGNDRPLGVFVFGVACCEFYDLMCLNVNSAVYVRLSEHNSLTIVMRHCLCC